MPLSIDGWPAYSTVVRGRDLMFKFTLGGSSAPTIVYGGSWIKTAAHTGGSSTITITTKDNLYEVVTQGADWRDPGGGSAGQYATLGQFTGEKSTTGASLVAVLAFFTAGGSPVTDPTGTVGGFLSINDGAVTT